MALGSPRAAGMCRRGYPGAQGLSHSLLAMLPSADDFPAPALLKAQLDLPGCIKYIPLNGVPLH